MKLLRHALLTLLAVPLILAAFVASVMWACARNRNLDTQFAENTLFQTETKVVVYGAPIVARMAEHPEVVLLGASNARFALRPELISPLLGGVPVHMLGIGGQSTRTYRRTVEFLYRMTPPERRKNILFVLGTWFGMFIPTRILYGGPNGNAIDMELVRYGVYRYERDTPVFFRPALERYAPLFMEACWSLMLPGAYQNIFWRELQDRGVIDRLPEAVSAHTAKPDWELNRVPPHEDSWLSETKAHDKEWGSPDSWEDTGFDDLRAIARLIHQEGGQFVIAELPSTSTTQETYANRRYDRKMRKAAGELEREKSAIFFDMRPYFNREEFFDWVHIKPLAQQKAARIIREPIQAALGRLGGRSGGPAPGTAF